MWVLKGPKDEIYFLLPGKHVVGRKNCQLVLSTDQSISRVHAVIEVLHSPSNWSNPTETPIIDLVDAGSKYGTSLISGNNTTKMEKDTKKTLKEGDVIHFGLQFNKWLSYEPLIVVVSSLSKTEKQKVRSLIGELGGFVVTDWHSQTSHLTMAKVTMTVKAISALAHAKPIVTPQYWISYQSAIKSKECLPKCEEYVPPIGETVLNEHDVSFNVNPKRKTLFHGRTFYFFSEPQCKDHGCMVQAAGGVAKLVRAVRHTQMKHFVEPDAVAMQLLSSNSQSQSLSQIPEVFTEVCDFLKSYGKRMIPASEIGLAVLHCSVEKYCNPDFSFASMLLRNSESTQPVVNERILATETQENPSPSQLFPGDRKVIPDSGSESKLGLGSSVAGSSTSAEAKRTQELLQDSQQATQLKTTDSQSQSQSSCNKSILGRSIKRVRVIDESDDEVEVLPPKKVPAGLLNNRQKKPPLVTLEDSNSDVETSTNISASVSCSGVSRLNNSRISHHNKDSDDPELLFADFKESQSKPRKFLQRPESSDMDAEDLFADFQDDTKPSSGQVAESHKPSQSLSTTVTVHKRNLPSDDESDIKPPEKRFAKLDLSKQYDNADLKNAEGEEEHFISTTQVKKHDESFNVKPSCNVSVTFKCMMVCRSKNITSSEILDSTDSSKSVVNYKKFKKVNALSTSVIPRIIGGRDLQPYQSFIGNNSLVHNGTNNYAEGDDDDDGDGEEGPNTLWGSLTQKSSWKNNRNRKF